MQTIEGYIESLFRQAVPSKELEETKQELKRHLLESVQEIAAATGLPQSACVTQAIDRFGGQLDLRELVERFNPRDYSRKTIMQADYREAKIEGSDMRAIVMRDVNLEGAEIFDSGLNGMRIHHSGMANLSLRHMDLDGLSIGFSQMNGAVLHDLGGHTVPIRFSENDFKGSLVDRCDLAGTQFVHCNLSGLTIQGSSLQDSWLLQPEEYEPWRMENVNMSGSTIVNCDLSDVDIRDCRIDGLRINGIPVEELLEAYGQIGK